MANISGVIVSIEYGKTEEGIPWEYHEIDNACESLFSNLPGVYKTESYTTGDLAITIDWDQWCATGPATYMQYINEAVETANTMCSLYMASRKAAPEEI